MKNLNEAKINQGTKIIGTESRFIEIREINKSTGGTVFQVRFIDTKTGSKSDLGIYLTEAKAKKYISRAKWKNYNFND